MFLSCAEASKAGCQVSRVCSACALAGHARATATVQGSIACPTCCLVLLPLQPVLPSLSPGLAHLLTTNPVPCRDTKKAEFLFVTQPALSKYQLSSMRCEVIKARDGLELPAYLTLPVGAEPKGLPLVLNVHGGPWARDAWGFRPDTQWFANRGYAVLQVGAIISTAHITAHAFIAGGSRDPTRRRSRPTQSTQLGKHYPG